MFIYIVKFNEILKKIFFGKKTILNQYQKKKIVLNIFFLLFTNILDFLSLATLFPIIGIFLSNDFFNNYPQLLFLNNLFLDFSKNEKLIFLFIFLIFLFSLKSFFLIYTRYNFNKIIMDVSYTLSNNIFEYYLNLPFIKFSQKNSSEITKNILSETIATSQGFILSLINLLVEMSVVITVLIFLMFFEFKISILTILVMGSFIIIFLKFFKNRVNELGYKRVKYENSRYYYIFNGINGLKEIVSFNKLSFFFNYFKKMNNLMKEINTKLSLYLSLTHPLLELFILIVIFNLILILIIFEIPADKIILILTLFSLSFFRVAPSISKITHNIQIINFQKPAFEIVYNNLQKSNFHKKKSFSKTNFDFQIKSLKILNFNFKYPSTKNYIFKNSNLNINTQDKIGIFSESGSGKTTLINILLGLIDINSGKIFINNKKYKNLKILRGKIGYVPQNFFILDDTIKKNIAFGVEENRIDSLKIDKSIKYANLNSLTKKKLNQIIGERGSKISGGQSQRIALARLLYFDPSILILDEATNSLDKKNEIQILKKVFNLKNKIIIFISHDLNLLKKFCNKIITIKNKKINLN